MSRFSPTRPVPVFAAAGTGAWGPVQELRGHPDIDLVASPRQASVLLVAGEVPGACAAALDRTHDQVPHPRRTVAWVGPGPADPPTASAVVRGPADDVAAALVAADRTLRAERRRSEPDRLPDIERYPWRGVGPHGQGGEGMMGGTPYGRPMAMTGDAPDGLALDRLHLRLGPFLDPLPAGLVLDVTLQGDVVQAIDRVELDDDHARQARGAPLDGADGGPGSPGSARRGLRWLAHALHVHGLDADASRAARLAAALGRQDAGDTHVDARRELRRLRRRVRRSGLARMLRGVGHIDGRGDATDRWTHHLDRIDAALSGDPASDLAGHPLDADALAALTGLTWTDTLTTIVSLGPLADPAVAPHPWGTGAP